VFLLFEAPEAAELFDIPWSQGCFKANISCIDLS
jgi:hypothetical protein